MELIDRYKLWKWSLSCKSVEEVRGCMEKLPALELEDIYCSKCKNSFTVLAKDVDKTNYCLCCGKEY